MKIPIIVGSHPGSPFLPGCLASLQDMECMVIVNHGYELGKIREAFNNTTYEEFLFIPDSVEFKRVDWIPKLFVEQKGLSIALSGTPCPYGSYMGKYRREVLMRVPIWETPSKVQAVEAERTWTEFYCRQQRPIVLFDDLNDRPVYEMKHGKMRMKIENDALIKWKGTWCMDMATAIDRGGV